MSSLDRVKTVFITGTSSGIGLACAQLFHSRGWNVVATMRDPSQAPAELTQLMPPGRLLIVRLDVQDYASIESATKQAIYQFERVDLLVNNAGYAQQGLFEAIPRERVQAQFDVNVFGVMDVTRAFLPHFRTNGGGGIIMVSSGGGFWALPLSTMYNASKFALEGFTESLSYECASQGIFVKSIVPHGGVSQTAFGKRAMGEMSGTTHQYQDYAAFTQKTWESFQKMSEGISISSMDVANSVLEAATDGTNKLRYWVGNDTRGFVRAVYSSKDDEEYMGYMRSFFN